MSRSFGARWLTTSSPMRSSPSVMSSSPTIIRSSVDFPQPDGPTRIMNSPSSTSMLTLFTAGKPSPYFLTMFFMSMAAMCSTLHCAGGQTGDDLSLEQQDDDDDGNRDHDRGGGQQAVGRVERVRADEERQLGRDGPGGRRRRQRECQDELVPREEEGQDRGREHPWRGQRHDHLPKRLPGGRPVDLGRLLHLPRDLAEEGRQRPDRQRQRERHVGDDQPRPGVEQVQRPPQVEQGPDQGHHREHRDRQREREHQALAPEVQAGDRVGRQRREDHREEGGDRRDPEGVAQGVEEVVVGVLLARRDAPEAEHVAVVLDRPVLWQELRTAGGSLARTLEGQRHDPHHREQAPDQDDDEADPGDDLVATLVHHASPLAWARSTRNSLTISQASSSTVRNSSTDSAEPRPSWNWLMTWRYVRNDEDSV